MKIERIEKLLPRLKIRNPDGDIVPLVLNPSQHLFMKELRRAEADNKPLWVIVLKARRVGVSTLAEGLLVSHCLAHPNANAMILAHQFKSSKALFDVARRMKESIPFKMPRGTQHLLEFPHEAGKSKIEVATAGSTSGGRGLSLSAIHFSEAAFFPGEAESFTSLLPAVPYRQDTVVIVESTANGKIGDGKAFYDIWCGAVEGRNQFYPIFIPWTMDPTCISDPAEASDAPADEEEGDLMASGVTLAQIAWRRFAIETKCSGLLEVFHQEYPTTWAEAFIESGSPAFNRSERAWARKCVRKPVAIVRFESTSSGGVRYVPDKDGVVLWDEPIAGHSYYIGSDVARGVDEGDYSAFVIWDGTTGEQVGRYAGRIGPEELGYLLDLVGRTFTSTPRRRGGEAMVNVEVTGGYGNWTQKVLRDDLHYPNLYRWKGKDDSALPNKSSKNLAGWETNFKSRALLLTSFREGLRDQRIFPRDEQLLIQIENATYDENWRWELEKGHDDILMAAMIGWIARDQHPPTKNAGIGKILDSNFSGSNLDQSSELIFLDDPVYNLQKHFRGVMRSPTKDRLQGI